MTGSSIAAHYAAALHAGACALGGDAPDPAIDWARSGAMALTGTSDGPPRLAPGPFASAARAAVAVLAAWSGRPELARLDGPALLGERAALLGLGRRGQIAPGGSCRLLRAADGFLALSLARPDDLALLPAWLGGDVRGDAWAWVGARLRGWRAEAAVDRARLLGLGAALATGPAREAPPWRRVRLLGRRARRTDHSPLVLDLSSLWAGPLCTQLLGLAGARVVKLESTRRPDGARTGSRRFFDLMNAGKQSVAVDLTCNEGVRALRELLERVDVVVEASRPRALAQLGIEPETFLWARPGLSWLSLTGYGRSGPGAGWIAYGDDAAVAAGLAVATGGPAQPLFCGDAIADPLTGLHAAVAAWASWRDGGGELIELSLRDVVAHGLGYGAASDVAVTPAGGGWRVACGSAEQPVLPPRAREVGGRARPLGADTREVLAELAVAC